MRQKGCRKRETEREREVEKKWINREIQNGGKRDKVIIFNVPIQKLGNFFIK